MVRYSRVIPVAGSIASRNPRSSPSAQYSAPFAEAGSPWQDRSPGICALYRLSPTMLDALKILRPETVIRWHRAGFRAYWRWRSQRRSGRPRIPADIRESWRITSLVWLGDIQPPDDLPAKRAIAAVIAMLAIYDRSPTLAASDGRNASLTGGATVFRPA